MSTPGSPSGPSGTKLTPARQLVDQLRNSFIEQIKRALGVELPDELSALAYVDHYLDELGNEDREPIVTLVASGAGAWFGEFVRTRVGGHWIGDGEDPRRLRLLLDPIFLHFSPVDLVYEAISGGEIDEASALAPEGALVDGAFQLDGRPNPKGPPRELGANSATETEHEGQAQDPDNAPAYVHDPTSDREWITARLSELSPIDKAQYFSLTGRFEALELILEMLAHRRVADAKSPRSWTVDDYVSALAT